MRTLKFYGYSDDLFEIEGTHGDEPDEIGCFASDASVVKVATPAGKNFDKPYGEGLHVLAIYATNRSLPKGYPAVWAIGISQLDEYIPLPDWEMKWSVNPDGYSTILTLTVPDDAVVSEYPK